MRQRLHHALSSATFVAPDRPTVDHDPSRAIEDRSLRHVGSRSDVAQPPRTTLASIVWLREDGDAVDAVAGGHPPLL